MNEFDPAVEVAGSELIFVDGEWPSFHDAQVHLISYWKGDIRPEDDVWVGPLLEIDFELCALEKPFFAKLAFDDCTDIALDINNPDNIMYDIDFTFQERGSYTNGAPLPPNIVVNFKDSFGLNMSFKCMKVRVLERYEEIRRK